MTQQFELLPPNNTDALTIQEAVQKQEHRGRYDSYVKTARLQRVAAEKVRAKKVTEDPTDATSLGLERYCGLAEPDPGLPNPAEPLWRDAAEKGKEGTYIRPRNRPLYLDDEVRAEEVQVDCVCV